MGDAPTSIDRKPRWVWDPSMGSCKHCGGPHLNSQCRPPPGPVVIPIGYCCPTAAFLKKANVRRSATPLDWSRCTLPMWTHVLQDGARALGDPGHVAEDGDGREVHALYREPSFPGVELWVHGHDPPSWARRCDRLRALLHESSACSSLLALHIGFGGFETPSLKKQKQQRAEQQTGALDPSYPTSEGTDTVPVSSEVHHSTDRIHDTEKVPSSAAPSTWHHGDEVVDAFVADAIALGKAAEDTPGLNAINVAAVLFVPAPGIDCSGDAATVMTHIGCSHQSDGHHHQLQPLPLLPLPRADTDDQATGTTAGASALESFAFAKPLPNTTVVVYRVPHSTRNGAGLPLPRAQAELLPQDSARLLEAMRSLFPEFFAAAAA